MRIAIGLASSLVVAAMAAQAGAAPVNVTNYNWLQLPPNQVTPIIGGGAGGGTGYGNPSYFRWGQYVWIPDGTLTGNGTKDYFATVKLDAPHPVSTVKVEYWATEGTSLKQFTIQGSTDGFHWTDLGVKTYGTFQTGTRNIEDIANTLAPGSYSYVRTLVKAGDYTFGSASRGGPGWLSIEPSGTGVIDDTQVNWANKPSFATTVANSGLVYNGNRYNDGFLFDDEGARTGEGASSPNSTGAAGWDPGNYAQINLNGLRKVNDVIVVWDSGWYGNGYTIQYSTDGTNFFNVVGQGSPTTYADLGATEYKFASIFATNLRITAVTNTTGHALLNQVLVFGVPEPTSAVSLLALGALALKRRRRR